MRPSATLLPVVLPLDNNVDSYINAQLTLGGYCARHEDGPSCARRQPVMELFLVQNFPHSCALNHQGTETLVLLEAREVESPTKILITATQLACFTIAWYETSMPQMHGQWRSWAVVCGSFRDNRPITREKQCFGRKRAILRLLFPVYNMAQPQRRRSCSWKSNTSSTAMEVCLVNDSGVLPVAFLWGTARVFNPKVHG